MIIIDAGVEREATAEEEVYIKKMHFYDEMMEKIKNATGLNEWKWIKGLNACNIYLVK